MGRQLLGVSLLAIAFVLAVSGADLFAQDKKKKDGWKKTPPIDSAKLPGRQYVGKLLSVPGTDRHFLVEITSTVTVPTGVTRGTRTRPASIRYKAQTVKNKVEFQASNKIKIRTMLLPETFDDKGNVKKYTRTELSKLRGKDTHLPGYEADFDRLEVGQTVRLTLGAVAVKSNSKSEEGSEDAKPDKKLQVKLMVILAPSATGN